MAENQYVSKVIYNGQTLIDLTGDTVAANYLLSGYTAHDQSGAPITGACTYDADTTDANAVAAEILTGKSAYVAGSKVTGSMTNNGSVNATISTVAGEYTVPEGYHDGGGKVSIDATEQAKIIAENIRQGITILGVTGTMSGTEDVVAEQVNVTPTGAQQVITPSTGYNYISQVTVAAIPYVETDNAQGGKTVTIGAAAPNPDPEP
jgi:hypothetical protein